MEVLFDAPAASTAEITTLPAPRDPVRTLNEARYEPSCRRVAVTETAALPGCLNVTTGFDRSASIVVKAIRSVCPALAVVPDGVTANAAAQTGRTRTTAPSDEVTESLAS